MATTDQESSQETMRCPVCEHQVHPVTVRSVAPVGGTLVTVHRCPGCEALLVPESKPTR